MMLAARPSQRLVPMAVAAILSAPARSLAPRWCVITTLEPMPMKLKMMMKQMTIWLETETPATASSEMWLTMKVSTIAMSMRRACSTKMGQASVSSFGFSAEEEECIEQSRVGQLLGWKSD